MRLASSTANRSLWGHSQTFFYLVRVSQENPKEVKPWMLINRSETLEESGTWKKISMKKAIKLK